MGQEESKPAGLSHQEQVPLQAGASVPSMAPELQRLKQALQVTVTGKNGKRVNAWMVQVPTSKEPKGFVVADEQFSRAPTKKDDRVSGTDLENRAGTKAKKWKASVRLAKDFLDYEAGTAVGQVVETLKPHSSIWDVDDEDEEQRDEGEDEGEEGEDESGEGEGSGGAVVTDPESGGAFMTETDSEDEVMAGAEGGEGEEEEGEESKEEKEEEAEDEEEADEPPTQQKTRTSVRVAARSGRSTEPAAGQATSVPANSYGRATQVSGGAGGSAQAAGPAGTATQKAAPSATKGARPSGVNGAATSVQAAGIKLQNGPQEANTRKHAQPVYGADWAKAQEDWFMAQAERPLPPLAQSMQGVSPSMLGQKRPRPLERDLLTLPPTYVCTRMSEILQGVFELESSNALHTQPSGDAAGPAAKPGAGKSGAKPAGRAGGGTAAEGGQAAAARTHGELIDSIFYAIKWGMQNSGMQEDVKLVQQQLLAYICKHAANLPIIHASLLSMLKSCSPDAACFLEGVRAMVQAP